MIDEEYRDFEAPIIKVDVLTDVSGPHRDINGPDWHRLREASGVG
jgi:hypothetical protein